jgi:hypothetical protein
MTIGGDAARHRIAVGEDADEVNSVRPDPSVWND